MKNDTTALKVLLYTAGGAAALAGMCAYLVAPGKRDKARRAPFMGRKNWYFRWKWQMRTVSLHVFIRERSRSTMNMKLLMPKGTAE